MKKAIKIISIFTLLLTMISSVFFVNKTEVIDAEEVGWADPNATGTLVSRKLEEGETTYGYVAIKKTGEIVLQYKHGFSELLIFAVACSEVSEDGKSCLGTFTSNPKIIHVSGNYARKHWDESKGRHVIDSITTYSVHLFKYFEYEQLVHVEVITSVAKESNYVDPSALTFSNSQYGEIKNTGFYNPEYCNKDNNIKNCIGKKLKDRINEYARTNDILRSKCDSSGCLLNTAYLDRNELVYSGSTTGGIDDEISISTSSTTGYVIVDNTIVDGASGGVMEIINDTIIPALLIILGLAAGVTITILGIQIIKGSDEAQERQDKIHRLRGILIGIAIAFILLAATGPLTKFIGKWLE